MKIGFANQAFPHIVPQVLAKPNSKPEFDSTDERNDWQIDEDEIHERIAAKIPSIPSKTTTEHLSKRKLKF